jgi:hypothetical protein
MDFSSLMANAGAGGLPGMEGLEVCTWYPGFSNVSIWKYSLLIHFWKFK